MLLTFIVKEKVTCYIRFLFIRRIFQRSKDKKGSSRASNAGAGEIDCLLCHHWLCLISRKAKLGHVDHQQVLLVVGYSKCHS